MKLEIEQIREVRHLSAAKLMRSAWLDEKLDAQARGDRLRERKAARLLAECDTRIDQLARRPDRPRLRLAELFTANNSHAVES